MRLNFIEFTDYLRKVSFEGGSRLSFLANLLRKHVNQDNVLGFYPKNIFVEDKDVEVYVFEDNKVTIFLNTGSQVIIKVLKYEHLNRLELQYEKKDQMIINLEIRFTTGDEIVLNNALDANSNWSDKYEAEIQGIFTLLKKD
ncbi:DUF3908 family protein [Brevibacillus fortis]|uniref:DUF3908 domain-containing protein n=1 Tax=Brevibacillus fortis TaxID=2126352 RepID=A0A2P7VH05_9BACL|nr:DUF3908 family protein [Brevibacillus fortis]PSJ98523.1 hypothetical protein C7R93_06160 [Brevibacillus fortis]